MYVYNIERSKITCYAVFKECCRLLDAQIVSVMNEHKANPIN